MCIRDSMKIISDVLGRQAGCGKTVLVITHDPELMEACCTRRFSLGAE